MLSVSKYGAARHWLELGFHLLPVQPGTKKLVQGFGVNLKRISTLEDVGRWWDMNAAKDARSANVAIIANGQNFVIDFDDWDLYISWNKSTNEVYSTSYTEYTPRGGAHVFLCGDVVSGLKFREGVEVKRSVLVAPSVVAGKPYETGFGDIYAGDVDNAFSLLTVPGTPTAYLLRTGQTARHENYSSVPRAPRPQTARDVIGEIKSQFSLLDVLEKFSPNTCKTFKGSGRFRAAICPFHKGGKEKAASFWIDTERNVFGCHTCKVRGDVINLYALLIGKTDRDAIRDLHAMTRGKHG